jgi:uncharacterized RDD family membrane protein YckC
MDSPEVETREARDASDSEPWRREVAARLNRYQSRRKPRPPRYPSLRLRFEEEEETGGKAEAAVFTAMPLSNQALALDPTALTFLEQPPSAAKYSRNEPEVGSGQESGGNPSQDATEATEAAVSAKIIEFPRSWTPVPRALDELAEPVMERPRILDVPEIAPPPPAMGGITIEPAQAPVVEKRPGIDIPLQSAPLGRRILSAFIDDVVIAVACALFAVIFWKMTAIHPPRLQIVGVLGGLGMLFWAVYQYVFVIFGGTTPGLRLARLQLVRFDESRVSRRIRRWRVLASFLSAASLGMGYVWVFLDEDSLCWHDRITRTYLAPKRAHSRQA